MKPPLTSTHGSAPAPSSSFPGSMFPGSMLLGCMLLGSMLLGCSGRSTPDTRGAAPQITVEAVDSHIRHLSSDEMLGRDPFSGSAVLAEEYIASRFREAGLAQFTEAPGYFQEFSYEYRPRRNPEAEPTSYELRNVLGYLEGTDPEMKDEFILFGAHHDHLGVGGEGPDTIFNGAEDNATGTTAVIALAEYFAAAGTNKRSLIFATFTAEERGLVGARHLAANLPIRPEQLVSMINFEMIGKMAEDGSSQLMYLGPSYSTLDEIFLSALDGDSPVELVAPREDQVGYFRASDNAAFHSQGFITMTLAAPGSTDDPYYHTVRDHYETLDVQHMTDVIRTVVDITEPLVMGEATPEKTGEGEGG